MKPWIAGVVKISIALLLNSVIVMIKDNKVICDHTGLEINGGLIYLTHELFPTLNLGDKELHFYSWSAAYSYVYDRNDRAGTELLSHIESVMSQHIQYHATSDIKTKITRLHKDSERALGHFNALTDDILHRHRYIDACLTRIRARKNTYKIRNSANVKKRGAFTTKDIVFTKRVVVVDHKRYTFIDVPRQSFVETPTRTDQATLRSVLRATAVGSGREVTGGVTKR